MAHLLTAVPIKVLIAEDHILYRNAVRHFLSAYPALDMLPAAGNGNELLQVLDAAPVDVVLLDIHMPVLDGFETLPLIRQRYPAVKIIVLSMNNHHRLISELMSSGATAYLSKNTDPEIIYQTIRECMLAA